MSRAETALPALCGLVDADFCLLGAVVGHGKVEPPRLGNEQRCAGSLRSGDFAEWLVMVGVFLLEDPDGAVPARDVDALSLGIVEDVVGVADGAEVGHRLARLGVKYQQLGWAPGPHEQTVVSFVECHGEVLRGVLYGPGRDY